MGSLWRQGVEQVLREKTVEFSQIGPQRTVWIERIKIDQAYPNRFQCPTDR